jgi:hypothetical protein
MSAAHKPALPPGTQQTACRQIISWDVHTLRTAATFAERDRASL